MAADFQFRSRDLLAPVRHACALRRSTDDGELVLSDMESSVRRGEGASLGRRPETTRARSLLAAAAVLRRETIPAARPRWRGRGGKATAGEQSRSSGLPLPAVRQSVSPLVDAVHAPAHPLRHATVSVPVLRQEVPPEVRHEEAHLYAHR